MADQRITQLTQLVEADVAATDVLPIADVSASETKKVTAKDLFEAGAALADNSSIDLAKLNQSSATKIGTTGIADAAVTAAKLATNSSIAYDSVAPVTNNFTGRGYVNSTSKVLQVWDGAAFQNTTGVVADDAVTTAKIANNAVTTAKIDSAGLGAAAIATGAITTAKIADGNVTTAKFAAGAVDATALASNAVTTIKVADTAITYAKIQDVSATDRLLGRSTAGAGSVEEIICTSAGRALLDDADAAAQRTTLGLGTLATQSGTFSGTHSGTSSGTNTGDQTITLTGDVTGSGTGSFATTISNNAVTSAAINANAVTTAKINDGAVTGAKLAADSTLVISGNQPAGNGAYQGQQWFNTNTGLQYVWTGSAWQQEAAVQEITFADSTPLNFAVTKPDNFSAVITTTLETQSANAVFVGPTTGAAAAPTFRALVSSDLPVATVSTTGAVQPGTGLTVSGAGVLGHTNTASAGTYTKVTIDAEGHVTTGTTLAAADIPSLDTSKITTGTLDVARIASNSLTGPKLANYAITKIGDTQPTADQIGQFFFNPLSRDLFLWDGNVYQPIGISIGEIVFAGTFDASAGGGTGLVASVTAEGTAIGLVTGQALPAAGTANNRYYLVVSEGGTITSGNAPNVTLAPPDIVLSNGNEWTEIDVSQTFTSVTASQVAFTPAGNISATHVQSAIEELDSEKLGGNGGTITGELLVGTTGTLVFEGATANGFETTLGVVDPTADNAINLPNVSGTVITTGDTATVTNAMLAGSIADSKLSTISTANKVNASALDIDGATDIGAALADADLFLVDDGGGGTNRKAAATRITDYAFGKVSGDITIASNGAATIGSGVIIDGDINASAAIAYSKLASLTAGNILLGNASNVPTSTAVTGDVTISSAGVTAIGSGVIVNDDVNASAAIAFSKLANVSATDKLLGRSSAGAGTIEEITCTTAGRALLDDVDAAAQRTTLGLGALATSSNVNTALTDPVITGTILEDVFTITDGAAFEVDPGNGSVQLITLGASRTPKATNFAAGEAVTLMVNDGTAYTLTWTDSTWGSGGVIWTGGSAPTLATSGYTVIQFWKVGSQVYGARVGNVA